MEKKADIRTDVLVLALRESDIDGYCWQFR